MNNNSCSNNENPSNQYDIFICVLNNIIDVFVAPKLSCTASESLTANYFINEVGLIIEIKKLLENEKEYKQAVKQIIISTKENIIFLPVAAAIINNLQKHSNKFIKYMLIAVSENTSLIPTTTAIMNNLNNDKLNQFINIIIDMGNERSLSALNIAQILTDLNDDKFKHVIAKILVETKKNKLPSATVAQIFNKLNESKFNQAKEKICCFQTHNSSSSSTSMQITSNLTSDKLINFIESINNTTLLIGFYNDYIKEKSKKKGSPSSKTSTIFYGKISTVNNAAGEGTELQLDCESSKIIKTIKTTLLNIYKTESKNSNASQPISNHTINSIKEILNQKRTQSVASLCNISFNSTSLNQFNKEHSQPISNKTTPPWKRALTCCTSPP